MTPMVDLVLQHLGALLAQWPAPAYFVGGSVRDLLLGRPIHDLDLSVAGETLPLARMVARDLHGAFILLDKEREIARVVLKGREGRPGLYLDFARMHQDDLTTDLADRDLTVNAMALRPADFIAAVRNGPARAALMDPCGGLKDLEAGRLRAVQERAFRDDPLRTLRVVRLAAELDFAIEPQTAAWARETAGRLVLVSAERIRDEIVRLLDCPYAAPYLPLLAELDLLEAVLPEVGPGSEQGLPWERVCCLEWLVRAQGLGDPPPHAGRYWRPAALQTHPDLPATLPYAERLREMLREEIVAGRARLTLLKLAALLSGEGRAFPPIPPLFRRLCLSKKEAGALARVGRWLSARRAALQKLPQPLAIYRLYRNLGEMAGGVLLLDLADALARAGPALQREAWQRQLERVATTLTLRYEHPERTVSPPPLVNGHDLVRRLGLRPGRRVGRLLEEVRRAQIRGEVRSREEALSWARRRCDELRLRDG